MYSTTTANKRNYLLEFIRKVFNYAISIITEITLISTLLLYSNAVVCL